MRKIAKPDWLKRKLPTGPAYEKVRLLLSSSRVHTVCQEAKCPNIWECYSNGTSTFMILGARCTRNCRFCNVSSGIPDKVDSGEPLRVAGAVKDLGLKYVVITSVTRDDLEDGGAAQFAATIEAVRRQGDGVGIEVLIPDFQEDESALGTVLAARPDVLNHNVETVPALYTMVRPEAIYQRSLDLLKRASELTPDIPVKSGLMVGLGETEDQLIQTMADIHGHGGAILTLGQYLQPTRHHLPVARYYSPETFDRLKETAFKIGFAKVASAPFVRSSYQAENLFCGRP
jgi:lipoic acid synthetase